MRLRLSMGVLPLAISSGAGSGAKQAIGTGVLGGMITATVLAVFLVPLFFVIVGRLFDVGPRRRGGAQPAAMEGSQ